MHGFHCNLWENVYKRSINECNFVKAKRKRYYKLLSNLYTVLYTNIYTGCIIMTDE